MWASTVYKNKENRIPKKRKKEDIIWIFQLTLSSFEVFS